MASPDDITAVRDTKPEYNFFARRSMSKNAFKLVLLGVILLTLYGSFRIALHRVRETERALDRGANYLMGRQYEDSLREFDKAISVNARKKIAWSGKGLSLIGLGRYDEALENYDKMIRRYPGSVQAWHGRGISLERLGRYQEAVESFDHVLEVDPDYQPAQVQRERVRAKITPAL